MSLPEAPSYCAISGDCIYINLHVQPRASKNEIAGTHADALKIRLTSPPVEGAANTLCREFIADLLKVPKSAVELVSGGKSRSKRLRVETERPAELMERLKGIVSGR